VIDELRKYGLASIHPSLSMSPASANPGPDGSKPVEKVQIEKSANAARLLIRSRFCASQIF